MTSSCCAGRVYGCDHDAPHPGPLPHQTYAALVGGPLGRLLLDITDWQQEGIDDGVTLMTAGGLTGQPKSADQPSASWSMSAIRTP